MLPSVIELRRTPLDQLQQLLRDVQEEVTRRAIELSDPSALIHQVMEAGFTASGDPIQPKDVGNGVIAITGVVKDLSTVKHRCHLYTVRGSMESEEEFWVWDENAPSYIDSETVKVDAVRRTVALHSLPDGGVIIQHSMIWDGERHQRKSVAGFIVKHEFNPETGEIVHTDLSPVSIGLLRRLPTPSGQY